MNLDPGPSERNRDASGSDPQFERGTVASQLPKEHDSLGRVFLEGCFVSGVIRCSDPVTVGRIGVLLSHGPTQASMVPEVNREMKRLTSL